MFEILWIVGIWLAIWAAIDRPENTRNRGYSKTGTHNLSQGYLRAVSTRSHQTHTSRQFNRTRSARNNPQQLYRSA